MSTSLLVFLSTILVFSLLVVFFAYENKKGRRLFASRVRLALDQGGIYLVNKLEAINAIVIRFVLGLTWRRLVHVCLRGILSTIAHFYEKLVSYFEYNHKKTKLLKKAKKAWQQGDETYLGKVSKHQQESKLSVKEKRNRKQKALEG